MTAKVKPPPLDQYMQNLGRRARAAACILARTDCAGKNRALAAIAGCLESDCEKILAANARDITAAQTGAVAAPLLERLQLNESRVAAMARGLRQVAELPDPLGDTGEWRDGPSGLRIGRRRVPLGVIGIIYESRPNVTADAAALCIKAGNAAILRGGSEALHSNLAIAGCIARGLAAAGLPADAAQVVNTVERGAVGALLAMEEFVDVLIPRGGKDLVARISGESRIPVLKHLEGVCHVYVDAAADLAMAAAIAFNAKTYRYGICGAMETLLVHRDVAAELLPPLARRFVGHGVELRGCEATATAIGGAAAVTAATEADYFAEYLGPQLAVRVVDDLDAAMAHIARYGSGHTDAIVTADEAAAQRFTAEVDSSSVMVNAPTCFADGYEYGLGAEIGISTNRLHARGPVGLKELTIRKFVVFGAGHLRGAG